MNDKGEKRIGQLLSAYRKGDTVFSLSQRCGLTYNAVFYYADALEQRGAPLKFERHREGRTHQARMEHTDYTIDRKVPVEEYAAIRFLRAKGETLREIGRRYGVSGECIRQILRKSGG